MSCRISKISYSIDEVKLMTKVKRYKRRWKEQRHYSEYLKCKLAKRAMQVRELKERLSDYENNGWANDLHMRIAELESQCRWIPVSEYPEDDCGKRRYLLRNVYNNLYPINTDTAGWNWAVISIGYITHYLILPEFPESEER